MIKRELIEDFFSREIKFTGIERELKIPKTNKIVSILGPRRAGKTWFFYYLLGKVEAAYVNLEDIAFRNLKPEEFFDVIKIYTELKQKPKTFLLDEIQVMENWEVLVRSLYDRNYHIFITGSSSRLLPKEISTQLRGRTLTYILLPFSFREYITSKGIKPDHRTFEGRGKILRMLREYLEWGGFPEVVLSKDKEKILKQYADEIFYKDFVERHKIRSLEFGRFLFEFSFQNLAREISLRKIKNFFGKKISDKTLYEYAEKLQDTLSVFFLEKFSRSIYLRKAWPKKIYISDTGISRVLGFPLDMGKYMENVVFLEFLRRTNIEPTLNIRYWKDQQHREIDFVIGKGRKINELIQVCYDISDHETKKRELAALLKASKELKCRRLTVITWDYEEKEMVNGKEIRFLPLWKWLLLSS